MKKYELLEIKRQIFHLVAGSAIIGLFYYNLINAKILLAVLVIAFLLSAISKKKKLPVIYWFLKHLERPDSLKRFPGKGLIFFVIGSLLAVMFFPKDVALASIAVLTLGDAVSHLVGRFLGRTRHPLSHSGKVLIEGSALGTLVAFLGAMTFVRPLEAFAAAFVAMLVEVLEIKINETAVDDNIIIPVVAGTVISLLRAIA
jgi:dolichol kinase